MVLDYTIKCLTYSINILVYKGYKGCSIFNVFYDISLAFDPNSKINDGMARTFLNFGNRKKLHWARSREYDGCGKTVTFSGF